ncbi:MAG: tRNA preQ1(34) S-adenosylmethionine ribosyltransferase-isomerase QueA [Gammaproteobacteria bacterium]|nr:tRNA preQ1(34) S-adenosylmethionine ribosyltransferase-isomerase QueA [Gammaproteobacteria bacterium]MBV9696825.1 tRNA preQ1(34) S-adenosylmethionine ribosyltransferase-isomerase QueA [Gammaproteobacteria bacterium]
MRRQDFAYQLPPELIAQQPPPERAGGRLLVLESGGWRDAQVRELPQYLRAGDLLVLNDTRVLPARLYGHKPSGGRVEILLERALEGDEALAQLGASKPIRPGLEIQTPGGAVTVLGRSEDLWRLRLPLPAEEFFSRYGEVPLPPYIRRAPQSSDRERYQSVVARAPGAVAAPTASLHFDAPLLARLAASGVARTCVTLHVGAGTFQPLRAEQLAEQRLHAERVQVAAEACAAIARTRAGGGRVCAVGTTVVRALEAAALEGCAAPGVPRPWSGETRLFITPGFRFQVADLLLTNFHLPESSLLMLVCAFAGRAAVLAAYAHAVHERYRFFSYGDAMLLSRAAAA